MDDGSPKAGKTELVLRGAGSILDLVFSLPDILGIILVGSAVIDTIIHVVHGISRYFT